MTREEVIAAIQGCTEKLGRVPNRVELAKQAGLSRHDRESVFWELHACAEGVRTGEDRRRDEGGGGTAVPGLD